MKTTLEISLEVLDAADQLSEEAFNARGYSIATKEGKVFAFRIVDGDLRLYLKKKSEG